MKKTLLTCLLATTFTAAHANEGVKVGFASTLSGQITNKLIGTIFTDHADAYVGECKMPK